MPGAAHNLAIGSDVWPGLAKLSEEAGELVQVVGKICAFPEVAIKEGKALHPDGSNLKERIEDEIADAMAAMSYVIISNILDGGRIAERRQRKLSLFMRWDREERELRAIENERRAHGRSGPQE